MWPENARLSFNDFYASTLNDVPAYTTAVDTRHFADLSSYQQHHVMPNVDWEEIMLGRNTMKEKTPETKETKEKKINLERNDSYDRAIVDGSRLEPLDMFRIMDDEFRKIYLVIDTSEVIDADTVDDDTIYALDVATARVVALNKDIKVYVYDPDCVRIRVGDFVKDYGNKEA